jgi:[ribosomal protein S5]-alanine N-acetyltransferase
MPTSLLPINPADLPVLHGKRCFLRPLLVEHVTPTYVSWLNDPEVSRYLESRFSNHTLETVRAFVHRTRNSGFDLFYGIWSLTELHIGNIKLGPIDRNHHTADIGFLIGDRAHWGQGIASEAISLILTLGFKIGIKKITAGAYENNPASAKALKNAGMIEEGFRPSQVTYLDERFGINLFGLENPSNINTLR